MQIQRIENQRHKQSFGTYLGVNIQEKILLCQQRKMFTPERLKNLEKIEDDGFYAVLEITDKLLLRRSKDNKTILTDLKKVLTFNNNGKKVTVSDLNDVYEPIRKNTKYIFHTDKFMRLFDNDFDLAGKIQKIASNKK